MGLAANWYQYGKIRNLTASAQAGLDENGRIVLYYTAYTAGNGSETVISQIASEELGVPREEIFQVNNDTDRTLETKITGACRTTYWVGGAVQQAARMLKEEVLAIASEELHLPGESLCLTGHEVFERSNPSHAIPLMQVAAALRQRRGSALFTGTLSLEDRFHRDPPPARTIRLRRRHRPSAS
jgi:CO/xanthine dehydrogenase Mo-binding subunit